VDFHQPSGFGPADRLEERRDDVPEPEAHEMPMPDAPTTILLVDDLEEVRHVLKLALESAGHEVLEAADGSEALAVEAQHDGDLDLLLTDVAMPGMDGPTLAQHLSIRRPRTPVLFVSANRGFRPPRGPRGKPGHFLPKPFRPSDLLQAVEDTLDGRAFAQA